MVFTETKNADEGKKTISTMNKDANATHNLEEEYLGLKDQTWWGHQTGKK